VSIGRLQLVGLIHAEHVLATGTDALDVAVLAGASYGVTESVRFGVECTAQDLEGLEGNDVDGGSNGRCGPSISWVPTQRSIAILLGSMTGAVNAGYALWYSF
jgi:hypothetical protein